jgi:hypothetical protein
MVLIPMFPMVRVLTVKVPVLMILIVIVTVLMVIVLLVMVRVMMVLTAWWSFWRWVIVPEPTVLMPMGWITMG